MLSMLLAIIVIFLISISNAGKGHQTPSPTVSPVTQVCRFPYDDYDLDLMVLVDTSCKMTTAQCKNQQEEVAETVTAVRGIEVLKKGDITYNQVRVGYIEYGSTNVTVKIDLEHDPINLNVSNPSESRMQLYYEIRDSSTACKGDLESRTGSGNLYDALAEAINEFESGTIFKSDDIQQDKKILIFTNCPVDESERTRICDQYEDWIRTGSKSSQRGDNQAGDGINVVMVNNVISTETFTDPDQYIYCLVEYDDGRIFTQSVDVDDYATDVLPNVQDEVCNYPTPAPTTDPTTDPTSDPTSDPTRGDATTSAPTNDPTFCPMEGCAPTRSPNTGETPPPASDSIDKPPAPTTDPTTEPTTNDPTTAEPTTPSPITPAPTTAEPTTVEPTTSAPTTQAPTTPSPTTSPPTTPSPTPSSPTSSSPITPSPVTTPATFPPTTPTLQPVIVNTGSPTASPSQPFNITSTGKPDEEGTPCPDEPNCDGTCVALIILCILVCCCCGLLIGAILYREREEKKKGYGYIPQQQEYEQEATVEYSASEAQAVVAAYDDDGNEAQQLVAAYDDDQAKPEPAVTPYKD